MTVQKSTTGKALVIVESPTKQRTISKILGPNYIVKSSFGHVRDLPSKEIGVDEQHDFKPTYVVSGKPRIISDLKDAVKKASIVYLATDPDREGEAIAWHLEQLLKLKPENTRRIFFHEITDTAIKESFDNARAIDHNLVDAQQARRVLDRLVGYKISPLLWRKITRGLSAGRVQSVAVRLLAERAKEIADFKSKVYWTLRAKLEKKDTKPQFFARVLKWQGKNVESTTTYKLFAEDYKVKSTVFDTNESLAVVNASLRKGPLTVEKVEKKEVKQHPKPPFITSTLQQDAYNKLGFSPQKTMQTAQSLYEGVEIGGKNVGLITYMRTDSFNVSKLLQTQTNKFIKEKYGPQFAPAKAPVYKGKVKGAQEAHEAIHPTDVFKTPQSIKSSLTADQYKLYELIWLRFVASQMADAIFNTVSIDISAESKENCLLRATGRTVKFEGYLSVYKDEEPEENEKEESSSALLPILEEGDKLNLIDIETKDHKTAPPPNYNEASLIKTLEKHGIGRPSTYAPTIKTIMDRKYIEKLPKTTKLTATPLGIRVTEHLKEFFKDIMDLSYTAGVEEKLDEIAEGNKKWVAVLSDFYTGFSRDLKNASQNMVSSAPVPTDEKCPICQKPMLLKHSRYGEYLACSDTTCKGKKNLNATTSAPVQQTNEVCDKCGAPMVIRTGRRGQFMACSAYPKCKNTYSIDAEGKKVATKKALDSGKKCPNCGKAMLLRHSARGAFLGCSGYPKCKTIIQVTPEEIKEIEAKNATADK